MKKLMIMFLAVLIVGGMPSAYAYTSNAAVQVTADVGAATSFTAIVHDTDLGGTAHGSALDFGTLIPNDSGNLISPSTKDIVLTVNTQGLAFDVAATGTVLANTTAPNLGVTIPSTTCVVTNAYIQADNSGVALPSGASVFQTAGGTWVGTNLPVYHSQNAIIPDSPVGLTVIEAFPGITDDPAKGASGAVLPSQPAGHYTGTITYTLTTR